MRVAICDGNPSWHQRRAGHIFSAVLILEQTESEVKKWEGRLKPDQVLLREDLSPSFFKQTDEEITANRERLKHLKSINY